MVGAVAGVLVAPSLFLDTNLMGALLIKAFAGGVLGGLNSLIGVFLGCLALGVAENLAGAYVSPSFADAMTFIVIIAVLSSGPKAFSAASGFARRERRRRHPPRAAAA